MDGYDAVLAAGVEHRIYSLSLPVLWRRLCRRSLYRIPGKGVDCNVRADAMGFGILVIAPVEFLIYGALKAMGFFRL